MENNIKAMDTDVKEAEFEEVFEGQEETQAPEPIAPATTAVAINYKQVGKTAIRVTRKTLVYGLALYGAAKAIVKIADMIASRGRRSGFGGMNSDIDDDLNDDKIVDGGTITE